MKLVVLGLEEFVQQLDEWNRSLDELENFLAKNFSHTESQDKHEDLDKVDGNEEAGFHDSRLIYERVDHALNDIACKISHLR